jgi:hypothetical protein
VIQLGKTIIAIDKDITKEIFVKKIRKAKQRVGLLHD